MASNDLSDAGVGSLARLLDDEPPSYRCVLSSLDLRGNSIGSKGCKVRSIPVCFVSAKFGFSGTTNVGIVAQPRCVDDPPSDGPMLKCAHPLLCSVWLCGSRVSVPEEAAGYPIIRCDVDT